MDADERRAIILDEVRRWREEGVLDEDTARFLESRYEGPAPGPGVVASRTAQRRSSGPARSGFAANALQFVGGLLLGAALVALVFFLDVPAHQQPWVLLFLGGVAVAGGFALQQLAPDRDGLSEAMLAAGFVPLALAGPFATDGDIWPLPIGLMIAALAVGAHVARRGRGPSIVVAGVAYTLGTVAATDPFQLFERTGLAPRLLWLTALLLYFPLLLWTRRETWTTVGLALFMAPLTFGFFMVAEGMGVDDSLVMEGLVGLWLGAFLAIGVLLGNRGLVAGAAAGMTIDAAVFAFDVGGAGTAVIVLVVLGGLLVWQAEFLRSYFGRRGGARL